MFPSLTKVGSLVFSRILFHLSDNLVQQIYGAKGLVKKYRGGGGGPEHFEMWLIKNTWPTPSLRHKND